MTLEEDRDIRAGFDQVAGFLGGTQFFAVGGEQDVAHLQASLVRRAVRHHFGDEYLVRTGLVQRGRTDDAAHLADDEADDEHGGHQVHEGTGEEYEQALPRGGGGESAFDVRVVLTLRADESAEGAAS
jgi:hypothetical protein